MILNLGLRVLVPDFEVLAENGETRVELLEGRDLKMIVSLTDDATLSAADISSTSRHLTHCCHHTTLLSVVKLSNNDLIDNDSCVVRVHVSSFTSIRVVLERLTAVEEFADISPDVVLDGESTTRVVEAEL